MRGMGHTGDQVQGRRTEDEYGNPIHHASGGAFPSDIGGTTGFVSTNDTSGAFPSDIGATTGHGMTGTHARGMGTDYGGSDQGQHQQHRGGHVVKLEKLPGGHKDDQMTSTTTTGEHGHEKKGIIEKIKEKLPGGHND